jgi:hypothetical protein
VPLRQVLTAWNLRRDALGALLPGAEAARADELLGARPWPCPCSPVASLALTPTPPTAEELRLVERALRRNPKSYGAWQHRKWVLRTQGPARADLPRELALCAQLLALDERNFHCWGFRRHVG